MLETEIKKLESLCGKRISIGVTADGAPKLSIGIPWIYDSSAYAMQTPNVYITPEDTASEETLSRFDGYEVVGFYAWERLPDYSFLTRFGDLLDLNVKKGDNISDISFLRELKSCRMLFLQDARFMNLDPILDAKEAGGTFPRCYTHIGLDNCFVGDISRLAGGEYFFSEFIVWNPRERAERDRWSIMKQRGFKYYEYK